MMRGKTRSLAGLLVVASAAVAIAQESLANESTVDEPSEQIIDEVTVLGVRDLAALRTEVIRAEDVVYDIYNELNDGDGYDIICKKETRIGSQIPRRVCQTRMFRDAVSEAAEDIVDGEPLGGPMVNNAKHGGILREKMAALANEHPELLVALKRRLELRKKFEQERAKKFD